MGMRPQPGQTLQHADCILSPGSRLGNTLTAGRVLMTPTRQGRGIIPVFPDPDGNGRLWGPDQGIAASLRAALCVLADTPAPRRGNGWAAGLRDHDRTWQPPVDAPGAPNTESIIRWLSHTVPEKTISTNDASNHTAFLHRYFRLKHTGTQILPMSESMDYGLPVVICIKVKHPGGVVVALAGEGWLPMTTDERSTTLQSDAPIVAIVANSTRYGTVRIHQERTCSGHVPRTDLFAPDPTALARTCGGHGKTVTEHTNFGPAFAPAKGTERSWVIEQHLGPEVLTTGAALPRIRARAAVQP